MDRLVIESILADVDEIYLSNDSENQELNPSIILGFKAGNSDQIINAFEALKNVTQNKNVELIICRTLVSGIYDLEIKTEALDEPVRILNKVIPAELLARIEDQLHQRKTIVLGTNVSAEENWITVNEAQVKECAVKEG
ncbi:hypothetical protein SAMN06265348_109226 [Pedobacter westerhofensis]|uniref:Uncharacterized protein n=1 Tax=Pedobacter westerhofensis TaxID=425512 RepID=A0A521EXZ2_9SPHI|nr:hypothetical protein [Pedobacter westerhofensis]SMO88291.1 hypothetical protein SAMN06265348_109226 [Pedobacter westerhofensis]